MAISPSDAKNVLDTEVEAEGVDLLQLNVPETQVTLRPHDVQRVHVRGVVPGAKPASDRDSAGLPTVSIRHSDDRLHIVRDELSTDVSDWRHRVQSQTAVHLDLRLPPRLDVTAEAPGGAINAASLAGSLDLTVHGGSIQIEQVDGPLQLRGSGGTLAVQNISGPSLGVQWASGPVTLEQIADVHLELEARGASTTVQHHRGSADLRVHGAPLTLNDLNGPCDAEVRGNRLTHHGTPAHEMSLRTVGGPIQVHLPTAHAASLILTGSQVALDNEFDFEGQTTPHRIEGTLNGGGPHLTLRAVQGTASCHGQNET